MELIKARVLGFCMGVRRAVDIAVEEAKRRAERNETVYTLGPLIHNPKVIDDLKSLGLNAVEESSLFPTPDSRLPSPQSPVPSPQSIIIRAHGISCLLEKKLRERGIRIVDATCPKVKANQLKTLELSKAGYFLFLAGEENKHGSTQGCKHAEIEGLLGYAGSTGEGCFAPCAVVCDTNEAKRQAAILSETNKEGLKTALLGQTTISGDEYKNIGEEIRKFFPDLEIIDTICGATFERQKALQEITGKVDAVIVAGGKESANTRRLFEIAMKSGKPCVLAEDAAGIPANFFKFKTVGLCAGASTPDTVIEEIENTLS